jgi:cytochrome c oxidase subunit II
MTIRTRVFAPVLALLALSIAGPAWSDFEINMPVGVTTMSRDVYDLHMLILWVCVIIGTGVYGAMITAIVKFRKSKGAVAAKWTHNRTAEVIWTVIPAAILVGMAIPAAETLIRMEDTRNSELTIKVTGYQWRWHYDYIDDGVRFFSSLDRESNAARRLGSEIDPTTVDNYLLKVDNEVVVPVNTKVRLLVTGADVIHAWWVPSFAVKKDAVPGFINEAWFTADTEGTYRGQCAELCGMDHGFMPIVVRVTSQEAYESWLNSQREQVSSLTSQ